MTGSRGLEWDCTSWSGQSGTGAAYGAMAGLPIAGNANVYRASAGPLYGLYSGLCAYDRASGRLGSVVPAH